MHKAVAVKEELLPGLQDSRLKDLKSPLNKINLVTNSIFCFVVQPQQL
jgi:hypothetical protein